jgi:hypothetical protein
MGKRRLDDGSTYMASGAKDLENAKQVSAPD